MNMRHWIGILVASLSVCLFAPSSAHGLAIGVSDIIEVVDGNGNIMTDLNGNPAIKTIQEGTTGPVSFEVIVPDVVAFSTAGLVQLVEQPPDPTTHAALISDVVRAQLFFSTSTVPALLSVSLTSDAGFPQPGACQDIGPGTCIVETGTLQDVTGALFAGRQTSFRVLVQSNPPEVPEPGTLLLLGFGLAGLGVVRTRQRA
jgi:hypothetical protein